MIQKVVLHELVNSAGNFTFLHYFLYFSLVAIQKNTVL